MAKPAGDNKPTQLNSIKGNVKARDIHTLVLSLIDDEINKDGVSIERFWELMADTVSERLGCSFVTSDDVDGIGLKPMTAAEARRFEKEYIPDGCGKHGGRLVSKVPLAYWININDSEFSKKARRYVLSRWFQDQLDGD